MSFAAKYGACVHWFPGHMARASQQISARVRLADVIVEVRDARLPLTSGNPMLEHMTSSRPRIVVLNKSDLASEHTRAGTKAHFAALGVPCLFTSASSRPNARALLNLVDSMPNKSLRFREAGIMLLVIGMSNVGKSSIINSLRNAAGGMREGHGAKTGAAPGITRGVSSFCVRRQPPTYVFDTPGIVAPRISCVDAGMKLVLCNVLPEHVVPFSVQAHFLLHHFEAAGSAAYVAALGLDRAYSSEDVTPLLTRLAEMRHLTLPGGVPDLETAARHMVSAYQRGELGRHTLDYMAAPAGASAAGLVSTTARARAVPPAAPDSEVLLPSAAATAKLPVRTAAGMSATACSPS